MYKGRAVGGPRNGILLQGGSSWPGTLSGNEDGYYQWDGFNWNWILGRRTPVAGFIDEDPQPERGRRRKK